VSRDLILVTGGSSDIGLALIRRLAGCSRAPVILAHCNSSMARVESLVASVGYDAIHPVQGDFCSVDAVNQMAQDIIARFGTPSHLVHLAGAKLVYERFAKFNWNHFETDFQIQVRAAGLLLKTFLPAMSKMTSAQVVFMLSSVTRCAPPKFMTMYTIVKFAQLGMMRSLASEYAGSPVSFNAVSPGMVETRFLDNIPDFVKEASAAASPKRRNAAISEVVDVIEFLLSPQAAHLTGVEIPVTGGAVL